MDLETIRLRSGLGTLSTTPFIEEAADTSLNSDGGLENKHIHATYTYGSPPRDTPVEDTIKKSKENSFRAKTKEKAKSLLHLHHTQTPYIVEEDHDEHRVLSNIDNDLAFHPTKMIEEAGQPPQEPVGAIDKARHNLQSVARAVAHPKQTAQSKAHKKTAAQLSWMQGPPLSDLADLEYLEAHEAPSHLKSATSPRGAELEEGDVDATKLSQRERAKVLEEHRDSTLVAWTTRHITRVAAIHKLQIKWPADVEAFVQRDELGNFVRYRWEKRLGYTIIWYTQNFSAQYIDDFDELPFDIDQLRDHVERIVVASAPYQKWLVDIRSIYRWERPWRTAKWLAIYTVIWYYRTLKRPYLLFLGILTRRRVYDRFCCESTPRTGSIRTYKHNQYSYVLYIIIKNRYFPSSVQALQESVERSKDLEGIAYHFGELVEKYGREDWIEPLVEEMGPYLQLQLNDIANILEVFAK